MRQIIRTGTEIIRLVLMIVLLVIATLSPAGLTNGCPITAATGNAVAKKLVCACGCANHAAGKACCCAPAEHPNQAPSPRVVPPSRPLRQYLTEPVVGFALAEAHAPAAGPGRHEPIRRSPSTVLRAVPVPPPQT